jgi:hypothetical protein
VSDAIAKKAADPAEGPTSLPGHENFPSFTFLVWLNLAMGQSYSPLNATGPIGEATALRQFNDDLEKSEELSGDCI